ncbi:hypothetical protein [Butyrivibrio sp. JL13D10]|uniref:hypothetical protein n=1 Tax=Butyrivibrio sp. JL13D10 TaxID=3236815 RepID=UPI0038B5B49B
MAEKYFDEETWKWVIKDIKGLSMKMITVMMTTALFMTTLTGCAQKSSAFFVEDNPIINEARADGREDEVYELRNAIQAEYEADMKKRAQKEADEAAQAVDPHPEWLLETTDMHIGSRESDGIGYGLIVPIPNKFVEYTEAQGEVYHSRKSREDVISGFKSVKYKDVIWQSNMDGIKEIKIDCRHDGGYEISNDYDKPLEEFSTDEILTLYGIQGHYKKELTNVVTRDGVTYVFEYLDKRELKEHGTYTCLEFTVLLPDRDGDVYNITGIQGAITINTLNDVEEATIAAQEYMQKVMNEITVIEGINMDEVEKIGRNDADYQ